MRVIWISVVLFAVLMIVGVGYYEPDISAQLAASAEKTEKAEKEKIVDNPFAEEVAASDKVELPSLPEQSQPSLVAVSTADVTDTTNAINSDPLAQVASNASSEKPVQDVLSETPENTPSLVDNSKLQTTIGETTSQASTEASISEGEAVSTGASELSRNENEPQRKLGLAMLELEKENKRNKIAVIVHRDNNQELSAKEIKAMYMDRLTKWNDGSAVMLYNLPLGDKFRDKFSRNILNMTALEADAAETQRRELHINVNPVDVKAKNIVVSYVEQHPNALAYVPLVMVRDKSNVKVILTIP